MRMKQPAFTYFFFLSLISCCLLGAEPIEGGYEPVGGDTIRQLNDLIEVTEINLSQLRELRQQFADYQKIKTRYLANQQDKEQILRMVKAASRLQQAIKTQNLNHALTLPRSKNSPSSRRSPTKKAFLAPNLMDPITYIDRLTGQRREEKVFWGSALGLLYGKGIWSRLLGAPLKHFVARCPWLSRFCGYWQQRACTKKQIRPFIESYEIDQKTEFSDPIDSYRSFNDFFIRKLKPSARPIAAGENSAVIPADGRFYFFQDIGHDTSFVVKGQRFNLTKFLQNETLAKQYAGGSMVLGRLCPTDYHRFHFPVSGIPQATHPIPGALYSVNPWAIRKNLDIFWTNKRTYCRMTSEQFGEVLLG